MKSDVINVFDQIRAQHTLFSLIDHPGLTIFGVIQTHMAVYFYNRATVARSYDWSQLPLVEHLLYLFK